jgi:integrase
VQGGKGRKDRDVMLSQNLLETLREHFRSLRRKPAVWLFPGNRWHTADHPISPKVIWTACRKAAQRAGIGKEVHPHHLRMAKILSNLWGPPHASTAGTQKNRDRSATSSRRQIVEVTAQVGRKVASAPLPWQHARSC